MLKLPFRVTDPKVSEELSKSIGAVVQELGWKQALGSEYKVVDDDISALVENRRKIASALAADEPQILIELIPRYITQLDQVAARIGFSSQKPSGIFAKKEPKVLVKWIWTAGLKSSNYETSYDYRFEKASMLFALGCAYNHLAVARASESEEELKVSTQDLCKGAGVFAYLEANCVEFSFGSDTSIELNTGMFSLLKEFMLFEASIYVLKNGKTKKLSPGTLAKLCSGSISQMEKVLELTEGNRRALDSSDVSVRQHTCRNLFRYQVMLYSLCAESYLQSIFVCLNA
jgi:hypothetical protein